jgi:hypothetical protein
VPFRDRVLTQTLKAVPFREATFQQPARLKIGIRCEPCLPIRLCVFVGLQEVTVIPGNGVNRLPGKR